MPAHLLHRQVHPSWIQQGRFTSQTFAPTPKDERLLSVNDGKVMTAAESFEHFTTVLLRKSVGVVSVTSDEVHQLGLTWANDPQPYPAHAVIDFNRVLGKAELKAKASALAEAARQRGFTYQPQQAQ